MRAFLLLLALLAVFLLGSFVEDRYAWPFGGDAIFASAPPSTGSTAIPRYSDARGAEDAPRNDVAAGASTDMQRCVNTMVMRRESEAEARTVCTKIITGIGG